ASGFSPTASTATSRSRSGSASSRTRSGGTWHEQDLRLRPRSAGTSGRTRPTPDPGEAALRLVRRRRVARPRRRPRSRRARPVELPRHGAEEAAAAGWLRAASPDGRDATQTVARLPPRPAPRGEAIAIRRTGPPPGFRSRLLPARVPLGFGSADRQRVHPALPRRGRLPPGVWLA